MFSFFCVRLSAQTVTLPSSIKKDNPFSLKKDLEFEKDMINSERIKILKITSPEQMRKSLHKGDLYLRLKAIYSLGYIADEQGRKEIENLLLNDEIDEIRIACVRALGVMRSTKSKEILIKALNDRNEEVRIWSAITLSLIGEKDESFKFFSNYYHENKKIQYYSCHIGFLYIGTDKVKPYLIKDLGNIDAYISIDAAIILAQIGYGNESFSFLKKNLSSPDKYLRLAALRGLAYIGDEPSLLLIRTLLNDIDPIVKDRANSMNVKYN